MAEDKNNVQDNEEIINSAEPEIAENEEMPEQVETMEENTKEDNCPTDKLTDQLLTLNDKYLRLSAEFDNYRKRTLKEKADLIRNGGEEVLVKILPVLDNFERALQSMENSNDVDSLKEGVSLIYNSFKDFLAHNGVKEIACMNEDFNTDEQEAITKIPAPSEDLKGKVVDCVQKGYTLHDKVIRFAKVVVGE